MKRAEEIRELNRLGADELVELSEGRLVIVETIDEMHRQFAKSILNKIQRNNDEGRMTVLILPYGPTGQYPILCEDINSQKISLAETKLFFMDEYADNCGNALSSSHPLSFRGQMGWFWKKIEKELRPKPENIIFPNHDNVERIQRWIVDDGPIEVCYGGIGIHGHLAFNEPEPGIQDTTVRLVKLNDFTVTINAVRSKVGGDLENFPRSAWTLGMKECLGAQKLRLYCRNDIPQIDWANTVLRIALLGEPGDDYPVTFIRDHPDWLIVTDRNTASQPKIALPGL
jgi:glucosamine-6-phosphate deaminase